MSPRRKRRVTQVLNNVDAALDLGIKVYRFINYEIKANRLRDTSRLPDSPYRILGIEPETPVEEKKRRYRQLQRIAHPDRAGDNHLSSLINQAWDEVCKREGIK